MNDEQINNIICSAPASSIRQFSYVGEHVSDDVAVGVLEQVINSMEHVKQDNLIAGPWDENLVWLNDCISEVWTERGPFPGIGSVLQYLGLKQGTAFHKIELADFVKRGKNPWEYVRNILDHKQSAPNKYKNGFAKAQMTWRGLGRKPIKQKLVDTLVRFELTTEQIKRVCKPDERREVGIKFSEEEIIENPYLLCEYDLGTANSDPISLDSIDRGMIPQGDARLFVPLEDIIMEEDQRRVRAVAVDVLNERSQSGDTILALDDLLLGIRSRFPEKRACRPDRDIFISDQDFNKEHLWMDLENEPEVSALRQIRGLEKHIAESISARVKRRNKTSEIPINWKQALINEFGEPKTSREAKAVEEKSAALQKLYENKISVLTGSAGTGKTSALKVFLDCLEQHDGRQGLYLLAPTGKARVRLSAKTKRKSYTIHQLLFKLNWFLPDIFILKPEGGGQTSSDTIIIDECSMVPTDLFGTLLKAINLNHVRRLILVGDPSQLPPIGPGRPFVDIVAWLKENHPECIATLQTTMRISDDSESAIGKSIGLAFADGYRSESANPGDDEILSGIAKGKKLGDLEAHFWKDYDDLNEILEERLQTLLGISSKAGYRVFNQSLGISGKPYQQKSWEGAESWQILSPVRQQFYGTEEINRTIQLKYRSGLINKAQVDPRTPRPFSNQDIVYTDKVIQTMNQRRFGWPRELSDGSEPLNYVANGEIGIVTRTGIGNKGDYLQVGFSTQEEVTYRYGRNDADENLELAYGLTVHKAQGSDFELVFLIIPKESKILSRELIYTGLTRFRKRMVLLIEGDVSRLKELRLPENSDTHQRNTFLFDIALRYDPDHPEIPYPEGLIHRTQSGIAVRSKSEVIVANILDSLSLDWEYEKILSVPGDEKNFRLPDFTIGVMGDFFYWEHLGMLENPGYRESWNRKKEWYQNVMKIPVVGDGTEDNTPSLIGQSPLVITSRDDESGGIDAARIGELAKKYILLG